MIFVPWISGQDMAGQLQCSPLNYWCPPVTAYTIVPLGTKCFLGDLGWLVTTVVARVIPVISTKKTPFIECIIPLITSYD